MPSVPEGPGTVLASCAPLLCSGLGRSLWDGLARASEALGEGVGFPRSQGQLLGRALCGAGCGCSLLGQMKGRGAGSGPVVLAGRLLLCPRVRRGPTSKAFQVAGR